MRLKRLYLKGYANIYNAMARTELEIDFTRCRHNVVVIKSENGSGKSSIINELHPFFSPPIVWLPDTDIQKTIEFFLDDGTILSITYFGWKAVSTKTKSSKCYIQRLYPNGEAVELNPNGNMNSGKDIISDLLGINDDYMNLAAISANSKGIGAMKPGERKRFMALIVSALTPFAKMYKLLAAKHSVLKSMITTINAKISQLGNIEIIQSSMDKAVHELKVMNNKKAELVQTKADIKAKISLLSINGTPTVRYKELLNQRMFLGNNINSVPTEVLNFSDLDLKNAEKEQIQLEARIESLDKILTEYLVRETDVRSQLENDKIKLESLFNQDILDDTQRRLDKAQTELDLYISRFEKLGFREYDDINEGEYSMAIDAIEKFNSTISFLASQYSREQLEDASKYINSNPDLIDCNSLITNLQMKLDDVKEKINQQIELINQSKTYSQIPIDCNHVHDCPFINAIVNAQESKMSDIQLQSLYNHRDELIGLINETKERLQKQDSLMQCIYQVRELVAYISSMSRLILKFPRTEKIKGTKHIIDCIANSTYLDIDISQYREYTNYITLIAAIKRDIQAYKEKIGVLTNSNKESWSLQRSIEDRTNELTKICDSKSGYLAEINNLKNRKLHADELVSTLEHNKALKLRYEEEMRDLESINYQIESLEKDVEIYQALETNFAKISTDLNNLNLTSIPELQNIVEQSKYQILLYQQYVKDYEQYSQLYEKVEMVKKYVSINGIQAEIMDYTMNQILSMVNQLTAMIFGGRFSLHKFEITAEDFMISFMDQELGIIRPDISMMSASQLGQLSMIISFVLLHNASQRFNIIRLDEVDNNLDNDNRLRFFSLVYTIMQILHFDQAIIISHNTELDLTNCDLIITRLQNPEAYRALINSGANIIADFMR